MGDIDAFALSTMAFGQQHQQQMLQSRWSSFDTAGSMAANPLMGMASQFGEGGALVAAMAQTALAGNKQFGDVMQRLTMPAGTDLAAASRFRQFQMTSARMGMSGVGDVFSNLLGPDNPLSKFTPLIPMLDPLTGGMFTKIAGMLDENLLTMNGASSIVEAAQFQNTMGLLDPTRAAMLQQSLLGRTRANARGRAFDQVADFGKESEFRMRNQAFTAGFSNDDLAMATLFAERQGIFDEGRAGALRGDPAAMRRIAKAQLAKARGLKDPNQITDAEADAAGDDLVRNEGVVGGGSLVARGARVIQQGLLQNAKMPELLGFMEAQGTQLRNTGDEEKLRDVVLQLQALGRAASMSTEAMTKNAMALQQQYGGTVTFNATALATGQSMERLFLADGDADLNLSKITSNNQVQRAVSAQRSQYFGRIALAQASGRGGELVAAMEEGGPEAAHKWLMSQGASFEREARMLAQRDPARAQAYLQQYESEFGTKSRIYDIYNVAEADEQLKLMRRGTVNTGEGTISGKEFTTRFQRLISSEQNLTRVTRALDGTLSDADEAALGADVQNIMGMSLQNFRQVTAGSGNSAGRVRAYLETIGGRRANERTAEVRADFERMQRASLGLRDLNVVGGGLARITGHLLDPNFDVIGGYGLNGEKFTEGLTNLLSHAGLIYSDDIHKAQTALSGLDQKQAAAMGGAIGRYAKTRQAYDASAGLSEEKRKPLRDAVQTAAGELEQYNIRVDRTALQSDADRTKGAATEGNTAALHDLTNVLKPLTELLGGFVSGGGALPTADNGKPAPSRDTAKKEKQEIAVTVTVQDATSNGVVAKATANDAQASSVPGLSAPGR